MDPQFFDVARLVGVILIGLFAWDASRTSRANARRLIKIETEIDSWGASRVNAESRIGAAYAEIARGEGRDTERAVGDQRALDLLAMHKDMPQAVEVVNPAPLPVVLKDSE